MNENPKILVTDDIKANRIAVKTILKSSNLNILEAESGEETLRLCLEHDDIALILLDIQMPKMDGFEVAEFLRDEESTKHIPIIFVTAINNDEAHKERGYEAGAIDYISKPYSSFILKSKVKLFVELWEVKHQLNKELEQRKKAEDELKKLAWYDSLTKLPNRSNLMTQLDNNIARVNRYGKSLAIIYMDLDGFKQANDTFGHDAGDYILVESAKRFKQCTRTTDTVARLGGDEFVILLTDIVDDINCHEKCRQLIESINKPFSYKNHSLKIGVSIGLFIYHNQDHIKLNCEPNDIGTELIKLADKAMYEAKKAGKNDFREYHLPIPSIVNN